MTKKKYCKVILEDSTIIQFKNSWIITIGPSKVEWNEITISQPSLKCLFTFFGSSGHFIFSLFIVKKAGCHHLYFAISLFFVF